MRARLQNIKNPSNKFITIKSIVHLDSIWPDMLQRFSCEEKSQMGHLTE